MKINHPSHRYGDCGPSALSIILGETIEFWSKEILKYRKTHIPRGFTKRDGLNKTTWTTNAEIAAMVRRFFPKARFKFLKKKIRAKSWVHMADPKKTYLVSLMSHMCVYQNGHFFENVQFYRKPESFRCIYDIVEAVMELPGYDKYRPTKIEKELYFACDY